MRCTKPTSSALLLAVITALIFLGANLSAGELKAFGHETPAYIDFELSEIHVSEDGTVSINIIRTGDFRQMTTIDYQTTEVEASQGKDYKGSGGTITFQPGEGYKTIILELLADDQPESPESFLFEITGAGPNTVVLRPSTTVWIEDAPLSISQPRLQIASARDGNILLSWEGSDQIAVERCSNPASGIWEEVDCTPSVDAGRCEVSQPLSGTLYFFRLRAD